jgi:hypothetical protein
LGGGAVKSPSQAGLSALSRKGRSDRLGRPI